MRARHPAVHRRDHARPVVDEIERHDRRHHQQRHDRDQRPAAGPHRGEERGKPPYPLLDQLARRLLGVEEALAHDLAQPWAVRVRDQRLHLGDIFRQLGDERAELAGENGHDQDPEQQQRQREYSDDEQCGDEPADAELLEAVGERIEQIGNRHAGDERQQDVAQQPQQQREGGDGQRPEHHLPHRHHRRRPRKALPGSVISSSRCCRWSPCAAPIRGHRRRSKAASRRQPRPWPRRARCRRRSRTRARPAPDPRRRSARRC